MGFCVSEKTGRVTFGDPPGFDVTQTLELGRALPQLG